MASEAAGAGAVVHVATGTAVQAHFATAQVQVGVGVGAAVAGGPAHAAVHAIQLILFQHDIDYPSRAFAVVFGAGRGNNFHALNLVGGQLLEGVGQITGQDAAGLVVDEHPHAAAAAQLHVALQVYVEQRHFTQHVGRHAAFVGQVLLGVVHQPVGQHFHDWLRAGHGYFVEALAAGF